MSTPEEMPASSKNTPMSAHHKWIAMAIWLGLLAAALVTSIVAVSAVTTGGLLSLFLQVFASGGTQIIGSSSLTTALMVGAALALVAIGFLVSAWLKLVSMSRALIVSFAWLERDPADVTLFFDWLNFSGATLKEAESETVEEIDLEEADSSLVGDVLRNLAYAWAALLVVAPVTSLIGVVFK